MFLKIILYLALFLPAMPKIQLFKGVTMYPLEFALLISFPYLLVKSTSIKLCRLLYGLWGLLFITTAISQLEITEAGGILRCIKGVIYVPLIYVGYTLANNNRFTLKFFLKPFIIASLANLFVLFYMGFSFGNVNIWDSELIGSGLSNKAFDIETMKIFKLSGGSHGAWGNYSAMLLTLFLFFFSKKELSKPLLYGVFFCVLFNLGMSVSRESLVSIFMILLFYFKRSFILRDKSFKLNEKTLLALFCFIALASILLIVYKDKLYIIPKIEYTIESIVTSRTLDNNLLLRVNGWRAFAYSLIDNPWRLLLGYGFNFSNYQFAVSSAAGLHSIFLYATVPESFFVEIFAFGGIIALYLGYRIWKEFFKTTKKFDKKDGLVFVGFFSGLLIVNIFSGASLFVDILYSQVLLLLGVLLNQIKLNKKADQAIKEETK